MKSAEGMIGQDADNTRKENLQPIVTLILQSLVEFGKPYGQNYVAQFLTADRYLMFRQEAHRHIETYGKLRNRNIEDLVCLVHYLIDQGLIETKAPDHLTIAITNAGKDWLADPQEMVAQRRQVRFSSLEKYLRNNLRQHRREIADRLNLKPWDILTDFTMDRIVLSKPFDLDTLSRTPGFNTQKCERFGSGIVKIVQDVLENYEEYVRASLLVKVKGGSYPKVRMLFQQNVTIPEIAQVCNLAVSTVCTYLRDLHSANQVDLIPWIEHNINAKALYQGVEYYERVRYPSLSEANSTLGIDITTLLFCRLYANDKRLQQKEVRLLAS
jgi:ATP-dependent DNA helicase RecQ